MDRDMHMKHTHTYTHKQTHTNIRQHKHTQTHTHRHTHTDTHMQTHPVVIVTLVDGGVHVGIVILVDNGGVPVVIVTLADGGVHVVIVTLDHGTQGYIPVQQKWSGTMKEG